MNIFFVASECTPFSASGGLGDVIGALPNALSSPGDEVSVILPLYGIMDEKYKSDAELVGNISFKLSWRQTGASVYLIKNGGVSYYFIENRYYFDRKRLYGEYDDGERFAFFSRAIIEFIKQTHRIPDILHANDWQTALSVVYLKTIYKNDAKLSGIKTVFTIHNVEYQGRFSKEILEDVFDLSGEFREPVLYGGAVNLLAGAMRLSDTVTTVSPRYAEELKYDYFAHGLSELISSLSYKMTGVINGIDYGYFSPETGGDIYKSYTASTISSGKRANKRALLSELSLSYKKEKPLIAMITRLTEAKGIDLVLHVLEELLLENINLVVLGSGEEKYERAFLEAQASHENLRAIIGFDRALSKKLYAAADMFLMPSRSEPCGLAQMIACSYGAIPIVRAVGGLYDTVIPYGEKNANGFRFDSYNAHELLYIVKRALGVYQVGDEFTKLRSSAKASDFSWSNSAQKYISIYKNLAQKEKE